MRTDTDIQNDVVAQLKMEPWLNPAEIRVAVKDGVVTLSGRVDSYTKKLGAEMAAKGIRGVRAVAEEIRVGVLTGVRHSCMLASKPNYIIRVGND